jgi:hypothetical protein
VNLFYFTIDALQQPAADAIADTIPTTLGLEREPYESQRNQ